MTTSHLVKFVFDFHPYQLTEHIYHQDFDRDSNTLEVFVRRLRKKLDPDNSLEPIETLRGRGYRFVLERNNA